MNNGFQKQIILYVLCVAKRTRTRFWGENNNEPKCDIQNMHTQTNTSKPPLFQFTWFVGRRKLSMRLLEYDSISFCECICELCAVFVSQNNVLNCFTNTFKFAKPKIIRPHRSIYKHTHTHTRLPKGFDCKHITHMPEKEPPGKPKQLSQSGRSK